MTSDKEAFERVSKKLENNECLLFRDIVDVFGYPGAEFVILCFLNDTTDNYKYLIEIKEMLKSQLEKS